MATYTLKTAEDVLHYAWLQLTQVQGRDKYDSTTVACTDQGELCPPQEPMATRFNLYGAVMSAPADPMNRREALSLLSFVIPDNDYDPGVVVVNWAFSARYDDAVGVLDAAMAKARSERLMAPGNKRRALQTVPSRGSSVRMGRVAL